MSSTSRNDVGKSRTEVSDVRRRAQWASGYGNGGDGGDSGSGRKAQAMAATVATGVEDR